MGTGDDQRDAGASDASLRALSEFLRVEREEILTRVQNAVRALPPTPGVDPEALLDGLPKVLDGVAEMGDPLGSGASVVVTAAEMDARPLERAEPPLDLREVVIAHVLLRDTMLGLAVQRARPAASTVVRLLNQAVDRAIGTAVGQFTAASDRSWQALGRIFDLELPIDRELDQQLRALLGAFAEAATAVDSAAIYVRMDDDPGAGAPGQVPRLQLRAAVGAEEDPALVGSVVPFGEGFDGTIAERGAPALVRWAARDPQLGSELARRRGVRALYGLPLTEHGKVIGVVHMGSLTAFDFSEQDRRILGAVAARAAAVVTAHRLRSVAQDAAFLRDDIVAAVAHDLRSPLGVVHMQAGLLESGLTGSDEDPVAKVPHRARSILRSAERMRRILADLSDYASLQAGRLVLDVHPAQAPELVGKVVESFAQLAHDRGVLLETELSPGLPALSGDGARLGHVLSNLVENALETSRHGGRVSVRAQHEDGGVLFSVEDTAENPEPEALARLFERNAGGERSGNRRPRALALAIARWVVEAHGGRIWAVSGAAGGTTFCFTVPAAQA